MPNKLKESVFDLWQQMKFEEAYQKANDEYLDSRNNTVALFNRAISAMLLKEYQKALDDFLTLIAATEPRFKGDTEYIQAGICKWLLGDKEGAVNLWREGLKLKMPYTGTGLVGLPSILYYASLRLKDNKMEKEAVRELKKRKHSIAQFLLGKITEQELRSTISSNPILKIRDTCKIEFYLAVNCLKREDAEGFIYHLEKCKAIEGPFLEHEYFMAVGELDQLFIN